jgi:hypothetical protein
MCRRISANLLNLMRSINLYFRGKLLIDLGLDCPDMALFAGDIRAVNEILVRMENAMAYGNPNGPTDLDVRFSFYHYPLFLLKKYKLMYRIRLLSIL